LAGFFSLILVSPSHAQGTFSFRKPITINQPGGRAVLTDFPLLVSIAGDTDLQTKTRPDGYDIMFKDSDGVTNLDFEVEYFDRGTGTLVAWVKIPSLPSGVAKTIYMDYGNALITSPPETPCTVWGQTSSISTTWIH
jgi:hypothetical protein